MCARQPNPTEYEGITTRRGNPGLSVQGPSAVGFLIDVLGEYDPVTGDLVVYHAQSSPKGRRRRY